MSIELNHRQTRNTLFVKRKGVARGALPLVFNLNFLGLQRPAAHQRGI